VEQLHLRLVISQDLMEDPNWAAYRALVKAEQLSSCWSMPIINARNILYGTFGTYYRTPKSKRPLNTPYEFIL
jgi:hypothetical protein